MKKTILALFSVAVLATAASFAHADSITFAEPQASPSGECCFQVVLNKVSSTDISVNVTLLDGATFFAGTGGGNHPTFAFNLNGLSGVTLTNFDTTNWTGAQTSVATNGPSFGTFADQFNLKSGGTSAKIAELTFDVTVSSGTIDFSNFIKNTDGYFFVADFLGTNGNTGLGAIKDPGTPGGQTPEPSSLMLLGTGIVGAAGLVRRRLARA